jgi:G:T-mismatch repair DNA endonuclease (very short patch repair protein)
VIKGNSPEVAVRRLFEKVGLTYSPSAVDWSGSPEYGAEGSNVVVPTEPNAFFVDGLHDSVRKAKAYHYIQRNAIGLNESDVCEIQQAGLPEMYKIFVRDCEKDLGIWIDDSKEL